MKKNMVPLLAIAFVVAIISTGVFYGLFAGRLRSTTGDMVSQTVVVATRRLERGAVLDQADVRIAEARLPAGMKGTLLKTEDAVGATLLDSIKEGEAITQFRLASRESSEVPQGMRAVSIRVSDSTGLMSALRPGARVDVQAVYGRDTNFQVRTILQNVEILGVSPHTENREGNAIPVATVLISPRDEDALALADSGARVRLVLRNVRDAEITSRGTLSFASLFQSGAKPAAFALSEPQDSRSQTRRSGADSAGVSLSVWVIGANPAALREIDANLAGPRSVEALQVSPFRHAADAEQLVRSLVREHAVEILSSTRLSAGGRWPGILNSGAGENRLRLVFRAGREPASRLRVMPEVCWKRKQGGLESRSFEADVPGGTDFLLSGLLSPADTGVLDQVFPGRSWNGRELLIIVSAQHSKPAQTAALTQPARRR